MVLIEHITLLLQFLLTCSIHAFLCFWLLEYIPPVLKNLRHLLLSLHCHMERLLPSLALLLLYPLFSL